MNWDAISAVAEAVGTIAVLITLLYLSVQLRIANKQRELESLRHNYDGINRMCELLSESTEKASIVKRGRESLENLTDEERMVFEFMHIRILNTVESWHMQLMETSPPGEYRDQQLENLAGVIVYILNYPGAQEIWGMVKHTFVPVQKLVDDALSSAETS
jgi:hypothetical protein